MMKRWITLLGLLATLLLVGVWVATSVFGAGDPRQSGTVIKVQARPDGSTDIYRQQPDGEIIVEHSADNAADGQSWFESNEVLGSDGKPIICPDGKPLMVPFDADLEAQTKQPSPSEAAEANQGLPKGKIAVFNEYSGRFQKVEAKAITVNAGGEEVTATEPLGYKCGAGDQPVLAPVSAIDPQAAKATDQQLKKQVRDSAHVIAAASKRAQEFRRLHSQHHGR